MAVSNVGRRNGIPRHQLAQHRRTQRTPVGNTHSRLTVCSLDGYHVLQLMAGIIDRYAIL